MALPELGPLLPVTTCARYPHHASLLNDAPGKRAALTWHGTCTTSTSIRITRLSTVGAACSISRLLTASRSVPDTARSLNPIPCEGSWSTNKVSGVFITPATAPGPNLELPARKALFIYPGLGIASVESGPRHPRHPLGPKSVHSASVRTLGSSLVGSGVAPTQQHS
ncbi:hypothetical protein P153DRAFT_67398 [Dothidotthia symphoricarpi CBS 119687]|uniref:Uncharacterized protein n=1 Tax=Dothidotthia symphoricarpi CBS 119687 TaxID=1392245 RepID=A0A6A6A8D7_9PLEO|nr:uncharacterized protein P153DRAFT_67398 [Dothidotthia symphoricarpi CBS 119687]KAF2127433.1 hypothetical protein P153DRAFT_67398 [Dothidotthia symphoricarpi CBS 119687]